MTKRVVFVTVGSATQPFGRLLEAVERLAAEGVFSGQQVFVQAGNNPSFRPAYCAVQQFLNMEEFDAKLREAELVISHAGAGTLLQILKHRKTAVVMPRQRRYGELMDDHQTELANELKAATDHITVVYGPEQLPRAIEEVRLRPAREVASALSPIFSTVARAIEDLIGPPARKR